MDTEKTRPPEKVKVEIIDSSGYANRYVVNRDQIDITEGVVSVNFPHEEHIYFFSPRKVIILNG